MVKNSKCQHDLGLYGYFKSNFPLADDIRTWVDNLDWIQVDQHFKELVHKDGELFKYLNQFEKFDSIEFIISLREAKNSWEEDGIWHDDGSRLLAFSISLLDSSSTQGGNLLFKKKGDHETFSISPFNFGEIVVFKTGVQGYEHKVERVISGSRLVVAGWCS